jgi:aldehyde:ferredoxin oxidoreductase
METQLYGYNGKLLRINLTNNTVSNEVLDQVFCRKYIGGAGLIIFSTRNCPLISTLLAPRTRLFLPSARLLRLYCLVATAFV